MQQKTDSIIPDSPSSAAAIASSAHSSKQMHIDVQEQHFGDSMQVPSSSTASMIATATPVYAAYKDDVIGNGESSVLFFYASWCPFCKENDKILGKAYSEGAAHRSTYKIDYDTATELKRRFGIVTQDTFVLIDGNGDVKRTAIHPTVADLLSFLQ